MYYQIKYHFLCLVFSKSKVIEKILFNSRQTLDTLKEKKKRNRKEKEKRKIKHVSVIKLSLSYFTKFLFYINIFYNCDITKK